MNSALPFCLIFMLLLPACADDTRGAATRPGLPGSGLASGLAIIGSDYKTTSVSLVDPAARKVVAPNFLNSGSKVTVGGTALSGDVVVARTPSPDGTLVLIDRGSGVLTFVDPLTRTVEQQLSVATGFYANPQDYAQTAANRAYVTRMGRNAKPSAAPDDFDEGDDVLILDLALRKPIGRVEMTSRATLAGTLGAPGRMAHDGKILWIPLASLAADFKTAGTGRIVGLDTETGAIVRSIDAPTSKNCVMAALVPGGHQVGVVCSGFFGAGPSQQAKDSNLLLFDTGTSTVQADVVLGATALEGKGPMGEQLAFVDATRAVISTSGDLTAGTHDRLWLVDVHSGQATLLASAHGAFTLSGLYADTVQLRIWAGEAAHVGGDLRVFDVAGAVPSELPSLASNPGGLGAVEMGRY